MFFGLLIFCFGIIVLLGQIFAKSFWWLWSYFWPIAVMIYGLIRLTKKSKSKIISTLMIAIGAISLLSNIGFLRGSAVVILLALALILFGLKIMFDENYRKNSFKVNFNKDYKDYRDKYYKYNKSKHNEEDEDDENDEDDFERSWAFREGTGNSAFYEERDLLDERFIFTNENRVYKSDNFSGGRVEVDFSSVTLDFKNVWPLENTIHLDLTVNFSDVTIVVPSDWHVIVNQTHYSSKDGSNLDPDNVTTLVINSRVFAGNLRIA